MSFRVSGAEEPRARSRATNSGRARSHPDCHRSCLSWKETTGGSEQGWAVLRASVFGRDGSCQWYDAADGKDRDLIKSERCRSHHRYTGGDNNPSTSSNRPGCDQ
jgi:hypothetical protein